MFALALALSVLAAPSAMAQSDLGLKDLGVAVGYVGPEGIDGTFSVGVFADHGTITPNIGLESRIDYWGQSETAFGAEASFRDIALGTRGKYYFDVSNPKIRPFMGAGLALHLVHAEVTIPAQFGLPEMTVEDSSTKLGLDLGGGMAMPIGLRTDLLTELWYGIVSDVSQLSLRFGVSYDLGS
jgi:outer membrane protein W